MQQRFSYDVEGSIATFIAGEIRDESIGSMTGNLTNTMLGNAIPIFGDVIFEVLNIAVDYEKAKEDSLFITTEFQNMQNNNLYNLFGCNVVVEYDTSDNNKKSIVVSEGIYTEKRVEAFNSEYPQYNISTDDVFSEPDKVIDIILKISEDTGNNDGLFRIQSIGSEY